MIFQFLILGYMMLRNNRNTEVYMAFNSSF